VRLVVGWVVGVLVVIGVGVGIVATTQRQATRPSYDLRASIHGTVHFVGPLYGWNLYLYTGSSPQQVDDDLAFLASPNGLDTSAQAPLMVPVQAGGVTSALVPSGTYVVLARGPGVGTGNLCSGGVIEIHWGQLASVSLNCDVVVESSLYAEAG
jgi:hypothetical protein